MTKRVRTAIAFAFTAVFITTAPVVLLYTAGYRYDARQGRFEKTGQISVETLKKGATVWLNGARRGETPIITTRLLPDDYVVRITDAGFLPWQKTLPVRSGETTFARDTLLFRDTLPELIHRDEIETASFSTRGDAAFVAKRKGGDEVLMLRRGEINTTVVARFPSESGRRMRLSWSPDATAILLSMEPGSGTGIEAYVYPASAPNAAKALRDLFAGPDVRPRIASVRWTGGSAEIIAATDTGTYAFDAQTDATLTLMKGRSDDAFAVEDAVVILVSSADPDGTRPEESTLVRSVRNGTTERIAELRGTGYRIIAATSAFIVLGDGGSPEKAMLLSRETGVVEHTFNASNMRIEPKKNGRLLFWNDVEIFIFDPRTGNKETVVRIGSTIGDAAWHPLGMHVLYESGGTVYAAELDGRDARNVFTIVPGSGAAAFAVDPSGETLMYAGTVGTLTGIYSRGL